MTNDKQTTGTRLLSHARTFLQRLVDLFDLSAPAQNYSVGMEEDISTAAWKATGRTMRQAMSNVQGAEHD
jgi:hypothetical protein